MAEADLDRRKPSMAGTAPAVAYFLEVPRDSCTVRATTKESRYSQIFIRNSFRKEEADYGGYGHYLCPQQGRCH